MEFRLGPSANQIPMPRARGASRCYAIYGFLKCPSLGFMDAPDKHRLFEGCPWVGPVKGVAW